MNLLTKPILYAVTASLLLSLVWGGAQCSQKQTARTDAAKARSELADYRADAALKLAAFEAEARQQEHRHAADMERVGREYQEVLDRAQADSDRVVADLRAGTLRLQERWRGCGGSTDVPDLGTAAGGPDAAAADREQGAARIVSAAAACDAQVRGLQEVIRSDRKLGSP